MIITLRLCASVGLLLLVGLVQAAEPAKEDVVWAEWMPNDWYRGKVTKKGDGEFHILFDDGDKAVVKGGQIALDKAPDKKDVKEGTVVLAAFKGGKKLYPGKVNKITKDGDYEIKFDDGDEDTVKLDQLRIIHK